MIVIFVLKINWVANKDTTFLKILQFYYFLYVHCILFFNHYSLFKTFRFDVIIKLWKFREISFVCPKRNNFVLHEIDFRKKKNIPERLCVVYYNLIMSRLFLYWSEKFDLHIKLITLKRCSPTVSWKTINEIKSKLKW